ncbi:hypothetical protein [Yersinia proxima]|uniref:hypothetical protein n=1 Tax=Yersinia proxima TaxID=2890316 RepID=UPI001D12B5A8|nr:hypothetical protein [Yersinia proxima]
MSKNNIEQPLSAADKHRYMLKRYKKTVQKIAIANANLFEAGEVKPVVTDKIALRYKVWRGKTADAGKK